MADDIASIGVKVDTKGIEQGAVALDVLASKGDAVDKAMSQVEGATARAKKSLDTLGQSARGQSGLEKVGAGAQQAATGMGAAGKAAESGATGVKRMADVLGGFSRDTSKAADALGLYASSTKNAIDHQRELERILDRANPSSAAARQLSEEVQTLNRALREGAIGNDTYRASMRNAFDEAEKAAGGVSKVGTAASMVTGLLTKLAGAAAVAVAFSFGKFISETIAAEQAQAQLQAVLKSTGESAGWTSDQLNAMAQGLASKSIFSVDQIKAAETRLLSYTGIVGQQFPRAMQAVIDMSSRMGMEVTSAAEQIGRALDIPSQGLTALTRQGFRFTEEQKEMVKQLEETGRVAEAQAIVLSAVESSYGGAAEAARGTFGGALKELQKSINDLMTGDGAGIKGMTRGVNNLSDVLGSEGTKQAFQTFIGWIADVSAKAIHGAANLIAFINASNKLGIIAGTDSFGQMKANAAEYSRQLEQLTLRAEGFQEAINRGSNVENNRRNLEKTREMIARVQKQAQDATQKLKDFANAQEGKPTSTDYGAPDAGAMERAKADAIAKADAARAAARIDAINKLMGVNSNYQEELKKTQAALASGAITQDEYVASLKKLATETWAATDAGKAAAEASKAGAKARDEAAKAAEREANAFKNFIASLHEKVDAEQQEFSSSENLTKAEKVRLDLQKQLEKGAFTLTAARKAETEAALKALDVAEQGNKLRKAQADFEQDRTKYFDTLERETGELTKKNIVMQEEIEAMGLTKRQLADLERARLDSAIAKHEERLATIALYDATGEETKKIREQIAALRERQSLIGQQADKQEFIDNQRAIEDEAKKTADSINQSLTDALLRGFEDGKGFASNFRDTLKNMFRTLVLRPIISFVVQPIGNLIQGAIGGLLGGGQGGAGNLLGTASNLNSAWGMLNGTGTGLSGIGYNMLAGLPGSVGYGMLPGMTVGSQQATMLAAQTQAFGGAGLQATAGAAKTAQGASWMTSNAAGIAAIAAPLIIGALVERNARDRISGAAYATSGGNDPFVNTVAGSTSFNYLTGDLPDRAALMARLEELGAPMEAISDWNDRALLRLMESAAADNSEFGINWTSRVRDMRDTPDFYRGAGYTHPEEMGWWNNKGYDLTAVDPRVVEASRALSLSIVAPLSDMARMLGDAEADFRVTTGFANRGKGAMWGALDIQRGGESIGGFDQSDFKNVQEYMRAVYSEAMDAFSAMDLPEWARGQVEGAQTAMDALTGDKLGEEAAALYQQTATAVAQTFGAIQMLIDVFPDFSDATQDSLFAMQELMGGMDALQGAYSSYLQNFWSEEERADLMRAQVEAELGQVGLSLPETRDAFRDLVEAQDLNTEAGRAAFAALMGVSGAFAQLTETAQAASPAVQSAADLLKRQNELLADQARLQADLMAARGDTTGAAAARRALDTEGYSDAELAIYDANKALSEQIELEKQRLDLLRQQQSIQADLMEAAGDIAGAQALRRELATVGFSEAALAIYDANQALRDQIAAIQQFSGIVGGIGNSLASLIQDGLLGNLSAADLGGRMADVVIGGVYNAMAGGVSQQITSLLMNGLVTPMVQAALVGTSVSEAVSRAAIDKMMAQATAVAQALGAVLSDPAFRDAMAQVEGIMSGLAAAMAPAQAYYVNWDTRQQEAQRAAQEAQRLADQQAQEAQRAADEEARRQQGIMDERMGLTKQLLQLEGNTVLLRQIELEALDPSNRALQQRIWAIEDETAAAEKYKSALKDAQDFLGGFTKNIEEFIFKVSHAQADAQQSYQMAAAKFTAQMTLALGGDRDAMGGITSYADTLIGSIRRESTTGAEANLRIARVLGQLASLPKQISPEQLIVDAIASANTSLEAVLNTNFSSLDANVDGLLTAGELAASGLATNTQISALMARVDANGDGMISNQELANSRLQTLATAQGTTNTNLDNVTAAQQAANTWLGMIKSSDQTYSLANVNAINSGTSATVAAINKTNAQIGTFNRNYDNPVTAQFSADSPLYSIFKGIDETNTWLYKLHGLSTASILYWIALLDDHRPVTVTSLNRNTANGSVFADGGFTGYGGKWEPAGLVHRGEVVWSQDDVARWGGPGVVDAMRQGAPGYADGGPVAVRVPQIYVPPVGRSNEETQALLREVLAELRAQRSDDRARHNSLAEPLQRMDRRGAKWDRDGLPAERTNEAIA